MSKKKGNPNWSNGRSGNPNGRPKTGAAELEMLRAAIKTVEKRTGKKFYERAVLMAYHESSLMAAILRKLVPDMQHVEHSGSVGVTLVIDKNDAKL